MRASKLTFASRTRRESNVRTKVSVAVAVTIAIIAWWAVTGSRVALARQPQQVNAADAQYAAEYARVSTKGSTYYHLEGLATKVTTTFTDSVVAISEHSAGFPQYPRHRSIR